MPVQPAHVMIEEHPKLLAEIERLATEVKNLQFDNAALREALDNTLQRIDNLKSMIRDILDDDK